MRVKTNDDYLLRRSNLAKVGSISGAILAFFGLYLLWSPWKFPWSYLAIFSAFFIGGLGNRQITLWVKEPRADQHLSRALRRLDDRHYLYHYFLPANHVLLTPYGLFVLLVKGVDGRIRCFKDKWQRNFSLFRLLRGLAPEPLGNPTREAKEEVEMIRGYIAHHLPHSQVSVQGVIVFTHPQVHLETKASSLPALPLAQLKGYLQQAAAKGEEIPKEAYQELVRTFDEATA